MSNHEQIVQLGMVKAGPSVEPGIARTLIDGKMWLILPNGTRVELGGSGVSGEWGSSTVVRFVDPAGSDSATGENPEQAMQTLQAAYDSLPNEGGALLLLPGTYTEGIVQSVNSKMAVVQSLPGANPGVSFGVTVGSASGQQSIFHLKTTGATNQYGWVFRGIRFDLSHPNTLYGILGDDTNQTVVEYCTWFAEVGVAIEKYLVRTRVINGDDCSWWRIMNNTYGLRAGIAHLGDGNNCNQNIVEGNVCFPTTNQYGIRLTSNDRTTTRDNNIEGASAGAIYLEGVTRRCRLIGDTGEGTLSPFVYLGPNTSENFVDPDGTTNSEVLIQDDSGANFYGGRGNLGDGPAARRIRIGSTALHTPVGWAPGSAVAGSLGTRAGLLNPSLATVPLRFEEFMVSLAAQKFNLLQNTLVSAEFWNGSSWVAWTPTNLAAIAFPNSTGFSIDSTHARFRLFTGNILYGRDDSATNAGKGAACIIEANLVLNGPTGTGFSVRVDGLNDVGTVIKTDLVPSTDISRSQSGARGVILGVPFIAASVPVTNLRIEFDLTGGALPVTFRYLSVLSHTPFGGFSTSAVAGGMNMRGNGTPEGAVVALPGSTYNRLDGGVGTSFYVKETGTGNTGWSPLEVALRGTGSPEGAVTAPVGSTYGRFDGGANTSFYVKQSGVGNTGWFAMASEALPVRNITATTTLTLADLVVFADATGGAIIVNLPAVASVPVGISFIVKKTDVSAFTVTIEPDGSELIDGGANKVVSAPNSSVTIVTDGSQWRIV